MSALTDSLHQLYAGKKILILGWGREGQSTYQLLRRVFPEQDISVADQNTPQLSSLSDPHLHVEQQYLANVNEYDVMFKAPGVPVRLPELHAFHKSGKTITSQLNEFLRVYRQQVIGVTGTKGKSTTSALIHHLLHQAGLPTVLLGNIGTPVFTAVDQVTPDMKLVIEMSSYHLETIQFSPHIAVFVSMFAEHLNYHGSLEKYLAAKANITHFQTDQDLFIFNHQHPEIVDISRHTEAQLQPYSSQTLTQLLEKYHIEDETLQHLSPVVQRFNIAPALLVAEHFKAVPRDINQVLKMFQPLPHRLQKIGEHRGITFVDDTLATIPEATCKAIEAYPNTSVIILGGFDRGLDYTKVVTKVLEEKIPTVLFFKPSGEKMHQQMQTVASKNQLTLPQTFFVTSMEEAVRLAYHHATPNSAVLLSPASPSHGQFKDYEDKSAQFVQWVTQLGRSS